MSVWGTAWGLGFPWGIPHTGADYGCELAQSGILEQSRQTNFSAWMCAFGEAIGAQYDVLIEIIEAFSIEFAVGDQLDKLGAILGLPRSGFGDDRYRVFLSIQLYLTLGVANPDGSWTGTGNNLLTICRLFVGPTVNPIVLNNSPPYSFSLSVPDVADLLEMSVLASFLSKALYSAVLGQVIFIFFPESVYCYEIAADTPDACIYCYEVQADTPGAGTYSALVLIGDP
jgi:hypothetical protein